LRFPVRTGKEKGSYSTRTIWEGKTLFLKDKRERGSGNQFVFDDRLRGGKQTGNELTFYDEEKGKERKKSGSEKKDEKKRKSNSVLLKPTGDSKEKEKGCERIGQRISWLA